MLDGAAPPPEVSVVVPHYADPAGLGRCLDALERQTLGRDRFEVIVADNASPDRAAVEAAIAGRARLVVVPERGAGPARNGGAAAARAPVLAFTDSDCVPCPDWLREGLAALDRHDVVGGRVSVLVDEPSRPTPTEAFEAVFAFDFESYITRKGFTGSGNMFVPRAVFEAVGGFRSAVSEDVDWSHRARGLGYTLGYAPLAEVGHPARRAWRELELKWRRTSRETFLLTTPRRAGRLRWLLRTWALPASALAHTPRVLRSPALPDWRARAGALAILYRSRMWRFVEGHRLLLRDRG